MLSKRTSIVQYRISLTAPSANSIMLSQVVLEVCSPQPPCVYGRVMMLSITRWFHAVPLRVFLQVGIAGEAGSFLLIPAPPQM